MSVARELPSFPPPSELRASRASRLRERLFEPVGIEPLALFRIAFGLIMVVEIGRFFVHGWIYKDFVEPGFHFTYYGFGWVRPWPDPFIYIHFAALGLLAAAIAAGLCYRVATVLFFFGFTYTFLLEETRYLNHFYLVCLFSFLLMFVPAHRAFSLDVMFRPRLFSSTVPAWTLWVLRAQICVVYFMGGVAKLNGDWLHGQPMRLWLQERTSFPLIGRFFEEEWMVQAFSYGGLCFDLMIAPLLIWRRTRWFAFVLAALFNIMNARLFKIGIFPWLAFSAAFLLFLDYSWLRRRWTPRFEKGPRKGREPAKRPLVTTALLCGWLAFQILVPLRHLILYPGSPEWSEEGHRFAWRMKLRDKEGRLELIAREPQTGHSWKVDPLDYIRAWQLREMSDHPEMILALCRHVSDRWQREHGTRIEVRAVASASLNGRPFQTLLDPDVDLAAQHRSVGHARWIKPLTTPLFGEKIE